MAFDELIHFLRLHRLGEFGIDLLELLDQINKLLRPFLNDFADGSRFVDQRFLLQIADGIAGSQHGLPLKGLIHACEDLQQGGFARSVQAENTDLRAIKIGKGNIFQHFTLPMTLGHADHGINNLVRFVAHEISLQKMALPLDAPLQRQSLDEPMPCCAITDVRLSFALFCFAMQPLGNTPFALSCAFLQYAFWVSQTVSRTSPRRL